MSTWRKKALVTFPDLKYYFNNRRDTIYDVFLALLPEVRKAHKEDDIDLLKKIYEYAEWCLKQKERRLWNAAGVGFYEHLADDESTLEAIPYWVKPDIYKEVEGLLEVRLSIEEFDKLRQKYREVNNIGI